jgi:signal peptidase I
MTSDSQDPQQQETSIPETLQSLIVAFALAMAVRSFVTEGFVIPTGSMAPTLMGQHARYTSDVTGYSYPYDAQPAFEGNMTFALVDPMVSVDPVPGGIATIQSPAVRARTRMGDRVLVLKFLYSLREPDRWDVVVFKNPTDPIGDAANFIKRLVGLPNEQLLMIDGDIFTAPLGADRSQFTVARKPEHIQRAVWQKVYDSDYEPLDPSELSRRLGMPWAGPPFAETGFDFGELDNRRVWTHDGDGTASLAWRWDRLPITDWVTYNVLRSRMPSGRPVPGAGKSPYAVSDIRFGAAIDARSPEALVAEYTLTTRRRVMRFMLGEGKATLRIETQPEDAGEAAKVLGEASVPFTPPTAGKPLALECWHVDQRLSLWINDVEIVRLDDVFESLEDRVRSSYFGRTVEDYARRPWFEQPTPPQLSFAVRGSALDLHRVRVDRDIYYRPEQLEARQQAAENGPAVEGPAFGLDFFNPAQLKADQFMMCGDNSAFSKDSRLWGRPSPLVTEIHGETAPFIVPRPLLLGKAWCVYFPAPVPPTDGLPALMPDFGQLRFIR